MYKAVILDFDGVILESCDIKTRAFRELFKEYPEHLDEIISHHTSQSGLSRYKKFIHFYNNILNQPLTDEKLKELGENFSTLVLKEIKRCEFVPGALEFLKDFSKKIDLFVASGTPENELRGIVEERGLEKYFKGVYGTPATKSEIIFKILDKENLNTDDVVFVGDSYTDYSEAFKAGVPFVGRIADPLNFNPRTENCAAVVKDLHGLIEFLNRSKLSEFHHEKA
jgi:phosphoglycolate phosphatase-like HAD superfamily hydrolase